MTASECQNEETKHDVKKVVRIAEEDTERTRHEHVENGTRRKARPRSAPSVKGTLLHPAPSTPQPRPPSTSPGRPGSSASWRTSSETRGEKAARQAELAQSFSRSLRLLGLHVEPPEMVSSTTSYKTPRVLGPSFSTRLHVRSVSLESVKCGELLLHERRAVSSAVYQEWYFAKLAEERERRLKQAQEKEQELHEAHQRKEELREKAARNFSEWKQRKLCEQQQAQQRELERRRRIESLRADAEKIKKALAEWQTKKAIEFQKQRKETHEKALKEAEKKKKDELEKSQHAREAYAAWIKKVGETTQTRRRKEKSTRAEQQAKMSQSQQRREEAQQSFIAWKQQKDRQLRTSTTKNKMAEEEAARQRRQRRAERLYEAEQAYLEWLDGLDQRTWS